MREPNNNIMEQMSHEIGNILQQISFMAEVESVDIDPLDSLSKIKSKTKIISHLLTVYSNIIFEKSHEVQTFREIMDLLPKIYSHKVQILGDPADSMPFLNLLGAYAVWMIKNFDVTIDLSEMSIEIASESKQSHISYYVIDGNACNFASIIRFLLGNKFNVELEGNKLLFSKINHTKHQLHQ